jgi:hypothetical protein
MSQRSKRVGTSLIDLIISMGIIAILFGGIYLVYFSIVTAIANINVRDAATAAIQNEIETIRNLPYASVGTIGGVPAGVIPQSQSTAVDGYIFLLATTIRNIDDPYDGTLGGTPNDTAPDDYKLVSIDATCPLCQNPINIEITTTAAPKNLESATTAGSLFIYAVDANGNPISGVTVQVSDASVTPSINLSDTTNVNGVLELVGVPTSTQSYAVTVTKPGFSTAWADPDLTVAAQTITDATFAIDRVSQLTVSASNEECVSIAGLPFSMWGSKVIGPAPGTIKFATTSIIGAGGSIVLPNLEWDTYSLTFASSSQDLAGTIPLDPITINPSSTVAFKFIAMPVANPAFLLTAVDATTGAGISNASATLSKSGFSETLMTGQATLSQTDWSGNHYAQQSGVDPDSVSGIITLLANASGTYATGTTAWLISNTFDVGGSSSTFYNFSWDPASQPPQTGSNSLEFQVAGNNDNATWNFIGPDGTAGTYFTSPGSLPASLDGDRYFRYEALFSTQDPGFTPELDDVSFNFSANCVPGGETLFTNLPQGNYTLAVTAPNYTEGSTTLSIGSGFQSSTIQLTPQ